MTYLGLGFLLVAAIVAVFGSIKLNVILLIVATVLATAGIVSGLIGLSQPRRRLHRPVRIRRSF